MVLQPTNDDENRPATKYNPWPSHDREGVVALSNFKRFF
jgi:hypothetical protein